MYELELCDMCVWSDLHTSWKWGTVVRNVGGSSFLTPRDMGVMPTPLAFPLHGLSCKDEPVRGVFYVDFRKLRTR